MFGTIRKNIGNWLLNKKFAQSKRKRHLYDFNTAQTIGVLFNINSFNEFQVIKNFLVYLRDYDNKVIALAYINSKKIPDYYFLSKGINFFTKKDLNFFFIPQSTVVSDFINHRFDILIDLSLDYSFPLKYIVHLSKANFKIGRFVEVNGCYDFMIDISKAKSLTSLIENIKLYLPMLVNAPTSK